MTDRQRRFDREFVVRTTSLRIPKGFPSPIQLQAEYVEDDLKGASPAKILWTARGGPRNEKLPEGVKLTSAGLLEAWEAAPGRWSILARATDDVGNRTIETTIEIEVF